MSEMSPEEIARQKETAMRRAKAALKEHFDTVLILASTKAANGDYGRIRAGYGDPAAQRGLAVEFVLQGE